MEKTKKNNGANIQDIAASLRAVKENLSPKETETETSTPIIAEQQPQVKKGGLETPKAIKQLLPEGSQLAHIIAEVKSREVGAYTTVYVDEEVKEYLLLFKNKTKVSLTSLVSHILETWIEEHKDDLEQVITKKKNRFM